VGIDTGSRSIRRTKGRTGGRQTVKYRDARGQTFDATVLSAGAGGGQLNLRLNSKGDGQRYLTNVPKATGLKQTGVWM